MLDKSELTLIEECIDFYLEDCKARAQSEVTVHYKKMLLAMFNKWCATVYVHLIDEITLNVLEDYRMHLHKYRKPADGKPIDISTQRSRLTAVIGLMKRMNYYDVIQSDLVNKFELPRVPRRLPKNIPNEDEVEQILRQTECKGSMGIRDRAIMELYYATGIRRAELGSLNIRDIDFSLNMLIVKRGKGQRDRYLPVAERALAWVRKYLVEIRPNLMSIESGDALFLGSTGKRVRNAALSDLVSNYIRRSGINKQGSCHLFRHAAATLMLRNGADIRHVQEFLGHQDISTTQLYTHVTLNDLTKAYYETHPAAKGETK